jgi:putative SOS response-associated peptidase YedK
MCNLYSMTTASDAMREVFRIADMRLGNAQPRPAIFPRYDGPVIRQTADGRVASLMHWGFLLPQVSTKTGKPIMPKAVNNARDDKLQSSSFWRASFTSRRCLVPASSFCEAKGLNPATYYWFGLAANDDPRPPFAFAGIWNTYRGEYRGEMVDIETYSIVTTTPNELVRQVHPDRMPVILSPDDHVQWLEGDVKDAKALIRPFRAEDMQIVKKGDEKAD